jgi:hypothetical protein
MLCDKLKLLNYEADFCRKKCAADPAFGSCSPERPRAAQSDIGCYLFGRQHGLERPPLALSCVAGSRTGSLSRGYTLPCPWRTPASSSSTLPAWCVLLPASPSGTGARLQQTVGGRPAPAPLGRLTPACFPVGPQSAWLLSLAGVDLPAPKEFDDPNMTCANLLGAIKKLGFAPPSYHPSKLTVGHGKEVVGVVDGLVDYVLERRQHRYARPNYGTDGCGAGRRLRQGRAAAYRQQSVRAAS